nr:hypothetical protein asmbl_20 [uncultured bacterium]
MPCRAVGHGNATPAGSPCRTGRGAASAVVVELQGDVEVLAAQQLLHRLQVVALLAADPQLVALDLRLDALGALVADDLRDLLGRVGLDALLDRRADLVGLARGLRLPGVEDLERDAALDQLLAEDLERGAHPLLGVGRQRHAAFAGPRDRGVRAPEVEPLGQLLARLVQRVVHLLPVDLAHHVEGRVGHLAPLSVARATRACGDPGQCRVRRLVRSPGTTTAGCPSGQWERTVNPSA